MKLDLPTRIRIQTTWRVGGGRGGGSEGFVELLNDVPSGTSELNISGFSNYRGYATSIELNDYFNFWAIVSFSREGSPRREMHLVLMPNRAWFDEWFKAIPAGYEARIEAVGEDKTGVK